MNNEQAPGAPADRRGVLLQSLDQQQFAQLHGLYALARMVTRRLKWIIGSILICVLLALLSTATAKPVYESAATIELSSSGSLNLGFGDILSQELGSDTDSLQVSQQTETAIIQSDSLALEVIKRLSLASQPPFVEKGGVDREKGLSLEESPRKRTRLLGIFKGWFESGTGSWNPIDSGSL